MPAIIIQPASGGLPAGTETMNILLMMLRSVRPSRISDMPAIAKPRWIRRGYEGMTFFGHIITHTQQEAEAFSRLGPLKNHEMIHLYQARSTHNSWFCFYLKYFAFWLHITVRLAWPFRSKRHPRRHVPNAGYRLNPFEMEAYEHMHNLHYLDDKPDGATGWRRYAQMTLDERIDLQDVADM